MADSDDGTELYGQSVSYTATVPPTGATQASPARTSLPTVLKKGPPLPPPLLRLELKGHRRVRSTVGRVRPETCTSLQLKSAPRGPGHAARHRGAACCAHGSVVCSRSQGNLVCAD